MKLSYNITSIWQWLLKNHTDEEAWIDTNMNNDAFLNKTETKIKLILNISKNECLFL